MNLMQPNIAARRKACQHLNLNSNQKAQEAGCIPIKWQMDSNV